MPLRNSPVYGSPKAAAVQLWTRGGTQTELEDDDIEIMKNSTTRAARCCHGWTVDQAIKFLVEVSGSEEDGSEKRFDDEEFWPERRPQLFPYALFLDIDETLFGGVLRGNVHLTFDGELSNGLAGATTRAPRSGWGRIAIELSRDLVFQSTKTRLVEVMLHQMTHAYLLQCCGARDSDNPEGPKLDHGLSFSTAALVIVKACGLRSFQASPSLLGVFAHPRRRRTGSPDSRDEDRDQSRCEDKGAPFEVCVKMYKYVQGHVEAPEVQLDLNCPMDKTGVRRPLSQYYHTYKMGRFTPSLRSTVPVDTAELQYDQRAILVPIGPKSLRDMKAANGFVFLSVPEGVDKNTFAEIYEFLTTGSYAAHDLLGEIGGPPTLHQNVGVGKSLCLRDIKVYRAGAALGVPELQLFALRRMWAHVDTAEDPVVALEWLYHGGPAIATNGGGGDKGDKGKGKDKKGGKTGDAGGGKKAGKDAVPSIPDEPLRHWAREFLGRSHGDYSNTLDLLRRNPTYRNAWDRLKARGGPLIADVDRVDEGLSMSALTSPSSLQPARPGLGARFPSSHTDFARPGLPAPLNHQPSALTPFAAQQPGGFVPPGGVWRRPNAPRPLAQLPAGRGSGNGFESWHPSRAAVRSFEYMEDAPDGSAVRGFEHSFNGPIAMPGYN